jgi:hypothetical protein
VGSGSVVGVPAEVLRALLAQVEGSPEEPLRLSDLRRLVGEDYSAVGRRSGLRAGPAFDRLVERLGDVEVSRTTRAG